MTRGLCYNHLNFQLCSNVVYMLNGFKLAKAKSNIFSSISEKEMATLPSRWSAIRKRTIKSDISRTLAMSPHLKHPEDYFN